MIRALHLAASQIRVPHVDLGRSLILLGKTILVRSGIHAAVGAAPTRGPSLVVFGVAASVRALVTPVTVSASWPPTRGPWWPRAGRNQACRRPEQPHRAASSGRWLRPGGRWAAAGAAAPRRPAALTSSVGSSARGVAFGRDSARGPSVPARCGSRRLTHPGSMLGRSGPWLRESAAGARRRPRGDQVGTALNVNRTSYHGTRSAEAASLVAGPPGDQHGGHQCLAVSGCRPSERYLAGTSPNVPRGQRPGRRTSGA